jgi:tetratricopeptide (TPR) repeat protein
MSDGEQRPWQRDLAPVLAALEAADPELIDVEFRHMTGEDHGTTLLPSIDAGLRWIHSDWDTSGLVTRGSLADLIARFDGLSERLGFQVRPPEMMVNLLGYRLLADGESREALRTFEYNVVLYPDSANVYDSLGEALEGGGELSGALRSYRRAVSKAEENGDRLLPVYRMNLLRVQAALGSRRDMGLAAGDGLEREVPDR